MVQVVAIYYVQHFILPYLFGCFKGQYIFKFHLNWNTLIRQKANCLHIQTKYDLSKTTTFLVVHDKTSFLHLIIVYVFYAFIPRVEIYTTAFKLHKDTSKYWSSTSTDGSNIEKISNVVTFPYLVIKHMSPTT